jgi:hypothetical protein
MVDLEATNTAIILQYAIFYLKTELAGWKTTEGSLYFTRKCLLKIFEQFIFLVLWL